MKRKGADLPVAPLKLNVRLSKCGPRSVGRSAVRQNGGTSLIMPPKLKGRLPLWRVCSVEQLRGLVKPRNLVVGLVAVAVAGGLFVVVRIARIA